MDYQRGAISIRAIPTMQDFDLEISDGVNWISLNDHVNYRVGAEGLGNSTQTLRRLSTTSPYYDGTFLVHSTKENVEEQLTIYITGSSQNHVTENILRLEELFSQDLYNVRLRLDDHMETWLCQPADYGIDRSHVNAHNIRATMKLTISRFPKITYEVVM